MLECGRNFLFHLPVLIGTAAGIFFEFMDKMGGIRIAAESGDFRNGIVFLYEKVGSVSKAAFRKIFFGRDTKVFFELSAENPHRKPHFCCKMTDRGGKGRSADAGEKNIPGADFYGSQKD